MGRPLTGLRKRERLNSTFDPEVIAKARALALRENKSLPQLVEELINREAQRLSAVDVEIARDLHAAERAVAAELRRKRR